MSEQIANKFIPLLGKMVGAATMIIGFILGSTVALVKSGLTSFGK